MDGSTDLKARRTAPKEVRRQQLIDATIDVIAEHGVTGATMAAVTGRAGLSLGIVSLHFESKDNLLKSTLSFLSEELKNAWTPAMENPAFSPAERLWAIIEAPFLPAICTPEKVRTWFGFFGEARYRAFYRELVQEYDDQRGSAIAALVDAISETEQGPHIGPEAISEAIEAMSDGLWLDMMLYPDWTNPERAKQRLWELLSRDFPKRFPRGATPMSTSIE